jgi:hypothetical protein
MRAVRNITVAVEPELYRQTRKIAAARAARAAAPAQPTPSAEKSEISPCTPVNPAQPPSLSATCEARLPSRTV